MNNRHIDVTSTGRDHLRAALSIAIDNAAGGKAKHYVDMPPEDKRPRTLVFLWHEAKVQLVESVPLPVPLDLDGLVFMAEAWLAELPVNQRPGRVDMDGDCEPEAFRVFNEGWGHVFGSPYAFVGVQGMHAWYGK